MEELNLGDLEFDTSSMNLFDGDTGEPNLKNAENNPPAGDTAPPESKDEKKDNEKNINTDGDDSALTDQESVANQSKDKSQVQAGKTDNGVESSDSSSPKLNETEQLYSNLAAEFKAKGVLPELEDVSKIRSMEDLNNAVKNHINSGLSERQKQIEQAQKTGAPVDEVVEKINTIDKLKEVTPEFLKDESNLKFRYTAIVQDFISKGYGSERAEAMAQRSVDAGTDIEDADFAIKSIIKAEENSLQSILESAKNKEKDNLNKIKNYISTTPEVIPGIVLTVSQKDELYNQITTDVGDNETAFIKAQKADPVGMRIKMEALHYLTSGFKDFSLFGAKAESKITNNIENLLRGAKFTGEGTLNTEVSDSNSNFKLADLKDFEIE